MDDTARIEVCKQYLRKKYATDVAGLHAFIDELGEGAALESVLIVQQGFEGGQASATVTLEPIAKLQAAMEVLAELDPDNMPTPPASTRYADFSYGDLAT